MNRSMQAITQDWPRTAPRARVWPFDSNMRQLGFDAAVIVFFFAATSATYLYPSIDRGVWLLADLSVVAMFAPWHKEFLDLARRNAVLLTWPALASLSALWSLTPEFSLYHGIQLFTTMLVGFLLCIYARLERLLPLLFTALLASAVLSAVVVIVNPAVGLHHAGEWQGLFPHKNWMGSIMSHLIIAALCLWLHGWRPWLMVGAIAFASVLLLFTRAGTPIVALAVTLAIVPFSLVLRKGLLPATVAAGFLLTAGAAALFIVETASLDATQAVLRALGKDDTLTGRTILWDIAYDAYDSRPWTGFGFKAWWSSDETGAPFVKYLIGSDAGSFHNTFLEVAVAFGHIGPTLLIGGLIIVVIGTVKAYVTDGRLLMLWPLLTVVYIVLSCFAETILFANHGFFQLLLVVAAASAQRSNLSRQS